MPRRAANLADAALAAPTTPERPLLPLVALLKYRVNARSRQRTEQEGRSYVIRPVSVLARMRLTCSALFCVWRRVCLAGLRSRPDSVGTGAVTPDGCPVVVCYLLKPRSGRS